MKKSANVIIALTHVFARKKATLIAAIGVALGIGVYLFMNSLSSGFSKYSRENIFKNNAHLKVYVKDSISNSLLNSQTGSSFIINNAQIIDQSKKLYNSSELLQNIKQQPYITNAISLVEFSTFYRRGSAEVKGTGTGVNMSEYAQMFNTNKYIIAGSVEDLNNNLNAAIIGEGLAEKLSLRLGDDLSISSSEGITQILKIVGIFNMGSPALDDGKCFVNLSTGRKFLKASADYVTTIYANTLSADNAAEYANQLKSITTYNVENWQISSADLLSGDKTRAAMMGAISMTILIVAAFGIYNILSSTISQKINDIAILKATGFNGRDVIRIFLMEALIMGILGTILGLLFGALLIFIMSKVYMGSPIGYFPISFQTNMFVRSAVLGIVIILCAGYFPAKKAANVDPVSIFRR
jgi:lipoprotein-releasing system permease protein